MEGCTKSNDTSTSPYNDIVHHETKPHLTAKKSTLHSDISNHDPLCIMDSVINLCDSANNTVKSASAIAATTEPKQSCNTELISFTSPSPSPTKRLRSLSPLGVGTFSIDHEAVSRGISSNGISKKNKMRRCGNCKGCNAPNCDNCVNCRNMIKNGGPGNLKQACIERRCINPNTPTHDTSAVSNRSALSRNIPNKTGDEEMTRLSTILPTTTAQMIKMEELATKYIIASVTTDVTDTSEHTRAIFSTNLKSNSAKIDEEDTLCNQSTDNGFVKTLRRAEQYVAEFDSSQLARPKLSYGAMCALAIQVYKN